MEVIVFPTGKRVHLSLGAQTACGRLIVQGRMFPTVDLWGPVNVNCKPCLRRLDEDRRLVSLSSVEVKG